MSEYSIRWLSLIFAFTENLCELSQNYTEMTEYELWL